MAADKEGILSRWSRLKRGSAIEETRPPRPVSQAADPAPVLPPIDELGPDSDFSVFMHAKVSQELRRAALKKLFRDPRFNVTDGLDDYAEDYTVFETLTPEMVDELQHSRRTLGRPEPEPEKEDEPEQMVAQKDAAELEEKKEQDNDKDGAQPQDAARRQDA